MVVLVAVGMPKFVYLFLVCRGIARPSGSRITLIGWSVGRFDRPLVQSPQRCPWCAPDTNTLCINHSCVVAFLWSSQPIKYTWTGTEGNSHAVYNQHVSAQEGGVGICSGSDQVNRNYFFVLFLILRPHPLALEWLPAKQASRETDGSKRRLIRSTFPVNGNLVVANRDDSNTDWQT